MTKKKTRTSIPQKAKVRAELQREIESQCPFCDSIEVGQFQIHHIDENPANNQMINLLLLCPTCHSKITKGDISQVEVLTKKIEVLSREKKSLKTSKDTRNINFNDKVESAVVGDGNTVINNIKKGSDKRSYPQGSIGFENSKANYISYLIDRFHDFKRYEVGKAGLKYSIIHKQIKKRYKIGANRTVYHTPIEKFEDLSNFLQDRISTTKLGRIKRGQKVYSTYEQYLEKLK